jgi:CMP/dCMP kinase
LGHPTLDARRGADKRRVLITVAGQIGSGKTEVCNEIGRRTGWRVISAGVIVRRMAAKRGMSVLEFNEYAKTHKEIDREIDGYLASLDSTPESLVPESLVIDSRLAWHFLPDSYKVYLVVDPRVGAERVFRASRAGENHSSQETASLDIAERQRLEQERFFSLYSVKPGDWRNYDLVIDTTYASPGEVADVIMQRAMDGAPSERPECWLSPQRLIASPGAYVFEGEGEPGAAARAGRHLVPCRLAPEERSR